MVINRQGSPNIPKNLDRDITLLIQYVVGSIAGLQQDNAINNKKLASEDKTKRLDRKSQRSTLKEVGNSLNDLDAKIKWAIIGEVETLEARVEDYIEFVRLEIIQYIKTSIEQSEASLNLAIQNQIAANNQQLLTQMATMIDDAIVSNNSSLMIEVEALIDAKIAEQHPPPPAP